jgi:hypothetical protein
LLRLPAVEDNAAMQVEPSKATPPKRKRRWFQFSLRTLMIGVTLLAVPCAYLGWQAKKVRDRKAWIESNSATYSIKQIHLGEGTHGFSFKKISPDSPLSIGLEYYRLNVGSRKDSPSWLRRLLGDEPIGLICLRETALTAEMQSVVVLFPEAQVLAMRRPKRLSLPIDSPPGGD